MEDITVTSTDDDALAARASAVKVGYWKDDYIKCFVKSVERKAPVINRGTYIRTYAIDHVVRSFLAAPGSGQKQIISLGAGSDTRFFTLATNALNRHGQIPFRYHEIDYPSVCQRKAQTISMKKGLASILARQTIEPIFNGRAGSIYSEAYCLHPLDLATLDKQAELPPKIDANLETLIINEVCLIYLDLADADRVLEWTRTFDRAAIVLYEPVRGDDAFGRMMIKNLAMRGLVLKTLEKYDTLARQQQRLKDVGFPNVEVCTMEDVYQNWLDATERERIAGLEIFDEIEEWVMLAEHYCVAVAWRGLPCSHGLTKDFDMPHHVS